MVSGKVPSMAAVVDLPFLPSDIDAAGFPSALVDFAEIQTQMDVDQFNMKYGVNLALPSGA